MSERWGGIPESRAAVCHAAARLDQSTTKGQGMRVKVEKEVFVEAEVDVSIEDLLAELEERARRGETDAANEKVIGEPERMAKGLRYHWGPVIEAAWKMLSLVPDDALKAFGEATDRMIADRLREQVVRWEKARYEAGRKARPDEVRQLSEQLKECGLSLADRLAWQLVRADAAAESIEAVIRFWREFASNRSLGALHRRLSFVTREKAPELVYFESVGMPSERSAFKSAADRWPHGVINERPVPVPVTDQSRAGSERAATSRRPGTESKDL
jgi:hypothetical protein